MIIDVETLGDLKIKADASNRILQRTGINPNTNTNDRELVIKEIMKSEGYLSMKETVGINGDDANSIEEGIGSCEIKTGYKGNPTFDLRDVEKYLPKVQKWDLFVFGKWPEKPLSYLPEYVWYVCPDHIDKINKLFEKKYKNAKPGSQRGPITKDIIFKEVGEENIKWADLIKFQVNINEHQKKFFYFV